MKHLMRLTKTSAILLIAIFPNYSNAVNFNQCLADAQAQAINTSDPSSLRFNNGSNVPLQSISDATAITIDACYSQCGTGQEPFDWAIFSQDFAAWLLPYLALISQLPFGGRSQLDNLMSALLTVGSPTLAGYSLFLTLLNSRWINARFRRIGYPTRSLRETVVRVLSSLQQVPLRIHPGDAAVFESLIVLPGNDQWWTMFDDSLNYTHSWSISSATSITWVIVAYLLTVADSLSNVVENINSNGQGTGSVWLWLLPIVVGWLVLAPKCSYSRIKHAYIRANEYINSADGYKNHINPNLGLIVEPEDDDLSSPDEARTPPVFNYSRMLSWSRSVYITSLFYDAAWLKAQGNHRVDRDPAWTAPVQGDDSVHADNRLGDRDQVLEYCQPARNINIDIIRWAPGVISRMIIASLVALALQWGTTGAAILAVWYTPTTRLGCRSLSYIIYGAASTLAWILLVLSSLLAHYARPSFKTATLVAPAGQTGGHQICLKRASPDRSPDASDGPANAADGASQTSTAQQPLSAGLWRRLYSWVARLFTQQDPSRSTPQQETHELLPRNHPPQPSRPRVWTKEPAMTISHYLRWIGKSIAATNAVFVVTISVFQYANFYNRCYCNSSVLGRGSLAYDIVVILYPDVAQTRAAWIGGFALASICSLFFVGHIYLLGDSLPS
ncbi:hypothetical protein BS17DRAFT_770575 [Gyrodon lividus]|nr:hypothetical protein BS17DRAFT_770575 [Gyrodon lividus]